MNKIIFLVSPIFALTSIAAIAASNQTLKPSYLFTQSAKQATVQPCANKSECNYKLTLTGVNPKTTYFADRPYRTSGHISTSTFLKNWAKGENSFKNDNPNASLVYFNGDYATQSVVELSKPRFNEANNTLVYNIKPLDKNRIVPGNFKNAVVFIDDSDFCLFGNDDKEHCSSSHQE